MIRFAEYVDLVVGSGPTNDFTSRRIIRCTIARHWRHTVNHPYYYSQADGAAIDYERFPSMGNAQLIEYTFSPGELLFLPIGGWHYVEGLEASMTMTYTNCQRNNGFSPHYDTYYELWRVHESALRKSALKTST